MVLILNIIVIFIGVPTNKFDYFLFIGRSDGRVNTVPDSLSFIIDVKVNWKKCIFPDRHWRIFVSW